jgi:hypothetical protein
MTDRLRPLYRLPRGEWPCLDHMRRIVPASAGGVPLAGTQHGTRAT